jgi:hypothetical protein
MEVGMTDDEVKTVARLRATAAVLYQHALSGMSEKDRRFVNSGQPNWMRDCRDDIAAAVQLLTETQPNP